MIAAVETTEAVGPEATPDVDEDRLAALEQDLADAAAALEAIEEITGSDLPPRERVSAINALTLDGRFAVDVDPLAAEPTSGTDQQGTGAARTPSDLVRNGDLGTFEQLETVTEGEPTVD